MLPSNSKTSIKQLLRWGLCAVALLGGLAQAQTTRPRIPELTCTSHPAILNTAISGANGYSNSSLPINPGETDEHWDYASSRIDYPTNIGTDYPTQNLAVDQTTGPPIKNPQADIPESEWKRAVRYDGPSQWVASPFNNAKWIGAANLPAGTTYFRYQFYLNDDEAVNNFSFNADFMVDDNLRQVFVNGVRQLPPADTTTGTSTKGNFGYAFYALGSMILKKNSPTEQRWVKGLNTIIFQMWNWGPAPIADSPSGILIQASGASLCGSGLQVSKYMQKGAGFDTTSLAPYTGIVAAGQVVYYNITVSNTGNDDLTGVTLSDVIPAGLSTAAGFS